MVRKLGTLVTSLAMLLALSACSGEANISAADALVQTSDLTGATAFQSGDSRLFYSYLKSGTLFPSTCTDSGKNELMNAKDSKIVGYEVPAKFTGETRNNDYIVLQEAFQYESADEAKAVLAVIQKSAVSNCSDSNAAFDDIIASVNKVGSPDFAASGINWYREQISNAPFTLTCGTDSADFRSAYWAQRLGNVIVITTSMGDECGSTSESGNAEVVKTFNAGESAAKAIGG